MKLQKISYPNLKTMAEDQNPIPQNQQQEEKEKEEDEEEEESSSQSPPSKVARVSDPGAVTMAVASPLVLGLGLGLGGGGDEALTKATGFTFMQMQEYHHQNLIFKHLVAGVPVPIHLILPIWKSVAASYGPHHYPSFAGLGNLCYDFRNSMEPEPDRCRRTDGKKWRCSRDVVPEQKYCERHMHRGRNRSRKPVEEAGANATVTTSTDASNNSTNAGSVVNSGGNDVTIARVGSSPISVLSSSACKAGDSKRGVL